MWLNQASENQVEFDDFQRVWNYAAIDESKYTIDVDAGWKELNQRIKAIEDIADDIQTQAPIFNKRFLYIAARMAAVLIIAFGIYVVFDGVNNSQEAAHIQLTAAEVAEEPLILSDGTEVTLNENAAISYPEVFASDIRRINFEGEAFFSVAHNPDKPFIIESGDLQVKVLGTSFNFCTCPEGDNMVLYLESGKVQFSSINVIDGSVKEQLILTPGQKGTYNKKSGLISKSAFKNQNHLAWKTGILTFKKTPLKEVLIAIEQTYDLNIQTDNSFEACCLTATFENETPESIFESIHTIFGVEYAIEGQNVVIK